MSGTSQLSNQPISVSSYHMKVPYEAQESGKEGKDKDNL